MKFIFLYEELAIYFQRCLEALQSEHQVEVHLFRRSVHQDAPFAFEFNNLHIYNEADYTSDQLQTFIEDLRPDLIYCAGWVNKKYLTVVRKFHKKTITVLGFDNAYNGSIRQRLALVYARFRLTPCFQYVFVPGELQKEFALRMGFSSPQIHTGAYSCDYEFYSTCRTAYFKKKIAEFPRRFIYVGRYTEVKGIENLWDAFEEISNEHSHHWELWCIGTGSIEPRVHEKIKHFGFVQPSDMGKYLAETGVFVLPSSFEPWGVVVHEFAAAGFPLILSDKVGAKESFLKDNYNGYRFESGSKSQLKNCLLEMMNASKDQWIQMSERSAELAKKNTPKIWAEKLFRMAQQ